MNQEEFFKKITAHAKEYGFVFPSSDIYDGLSAVYDYGQNGVELKNNIRQYWWKAMVQMHENIVGGRHLLHCEHATVDSERQQKPKQYHAPQNTAYKRRAFLKQRAKQQCKYY